jgi:hypothetical protein
MRTIAIRTALMLLVALAATPALAQMQMAPQAQQTARLHGIIEKVDGNTVTAKSGKGDELTLHLADKVRVTEVTKATLADIKDGSFIGSGAIPQPDGTQKAVEVHIFAESMRGAGEGHRPWNGAAGGTMTNGTVGSTVTEVNGPVLTVKYKEGEKKIIVPPGTPIVKFDPGTMSDVKAGAPFAVIAALKRPDGGFDVSSINVGSGGVAPP